MDGVGDKRASDKCGDNCFSQKLGDVRAGGSLARRHTIFLYTYNRAFVRYPYIEFAELLSQISIANSKRARVKSARHELKFSLNLLR